ncbi:MAG: sulfurtransferase complex subunit TusD [Gammaproteobacteria bacterium]|jgi:tRNA 2-thiouridine synthesizing protein D|nr:sulfurtransferase complex subunit TusD [Gammaproteobacteria bacterium]MBP6050665.1 sulfurtransferase complex subunit TusD [Pseudomonadales bacterium]MBK6585480.1 sulfurtransferase complex subunit TusD [Gammaproteobacteria bacterium]MBK7168871.1 sulfurtransferase complex subunit TusD [Gammaproteobacteria bacterium]MBK7521025.1 sulfurtransferase complex subunit TusD [Gammaproteobacteria bacterium]
MIFSLLVQESPVGRESSLAAYRFARGCIDAGHTLFRVFFFRDGVQHGSGLNIATASEANLPRSWQELAVVHQVDLVVCVSSALRRGIIDEKEASRHGLAGSNLRPGFEISGMGQLVEACIRSDRVLSFGG